MKNSTYLRCFEFSDWNKKFAGQTEAENVAEANAIMAKMAEDDGETWVEDNYVLTAVYVDEEAMAVKLDEFKAFVMARADDFQASTTETFAQFLERMLRESGIDGRIK